MSRRLEKINRTVRETVSRVIQEQLSDPRIKGMISVTRVETSADISYAKVYLSIMGVSQKQQESTTEAVRHAAGFIQSRLAGVLTTRSCPTLTFLLDNSLKKSFEILQLINQISAENDQTETHSNQTHAPDDSETIE